MNDLPPDLNRLALRLTQHCALSLVPVSQELCRWIQDYQRPPRAYHTLTHANAVASCLEELSPNADLDLPLLLAGWLHDVIYDPRASDNEERSARYAAGALQRLRAPDPWQSEVARLILATANHQPIDSRESLLCDADLSILGAPRDAYRLYCDAIRTEYAWVPDFRFRQGRAQVLRSLLSRKAIFSTPEAQERWERQARENLSWELDQLHEP